MEYKLAIENSEVDLSMRIVEGSARHTWVEKEQVWYEMNRSFPID